MEEYECDKFNRHVEKTSNLFKNLGLGIAFFQVVFMSLFIMNSNYHFYLLISLLFIVIGRNKYIFKWNRFTNFEYGWLYVIHEETINW